MNRMEEDRITLCGDNCRYCPRYLAETEEELKAVAELWYRAGLRDRMLTAQEINCAGCSSHKVCTYHLVECIAEHHVQKCNQCKEFPCNKVKDMLSRTKAFEHDCKKKCSEDEYNALKNAFFSKESNLER